MVGAIRYPAVARGDAILRICLTARHTDEHIRFSSRPSAKSLTVLSATHHGDVLREVVILMKAGLGGSTAARIVGQPVWGGQRLRDDDCVALPTACRVYLGVDRSPDATVECCSSSISHAPNGPVPRHDAVVTMARTVASCVSDAAITRAPDSEAGTQLSPWAVLPRISPTAAHAHISALTVKTTRPRKDVRPLENLESTAAHHNQTPRPSTPPPCRIPVSEQPSL